MQQAEFAWFLWTFCIVVVCSHSLPIDKASRPQVNTIPDIEIEMECRKGPRCHSLTTHILAHVRKSKLVHKWELKNETVFEEKVCFKGRPNVRDAL